MVLQISLTVLAVLLTASALAALLSPAWLPHVLRRLTRPRFEHTSGEFVAEVWLDWEICRGSTMYRQRFVSEKEALSEVRNRARMLDRVLPTHYRSEDWSGRPRLERYEFEIRWGVRRITDAERLEGVRPVWSLALPGTEEYCGEHASAHPLAQTPEAAAQAAGYRV
jgi:hypothetical protein